LSSFLGGAASNVVASAAPIVAAARAWGSGGCGIN
jgi:hypothetical protein